MPAVCFYFQVHQPNRLRRYSAFDSGQRYFDDSRNREIVRKVAGKCYLPATQMLLDLIQRHQGRFRIAFSLSGVVVEQFQRFAPEVLENFRKLSETGCCEFLAETYHHSLAFLYSHEEFREQIDMHSRLMEDLFNQRPSVFRNTELIYSNDLAAYLAQQDFRGVLAEGVDQVLAGRPPNMLYTPPDLPQITLLLKNYGLSDDVAFRFSNEAWGGWPLTAEKYANWIHRLDEQDAQICNLFMDFETFGEHQWKDTGIFRFLQELPSRILALGDHFMTPGETIDFFEPRDVYDAPKMTSWADTERDLSAWLGNTMQTSAMQDLYRLEPKVKAADDPDLLRDWRRLTTSDHFYYMSTKYYADGAVHKYFSPYESPYDSYINFMNVLENLKDRLK